MFEFNVSPGLIKAARKELRKNIDSQHAVVKRLYRQVDRISAKHFKKIWAVSFASIVLIDIISPFGGDSYFSSFHIGFALTMLLILPVLIGMVIAGVMTNIFYKKHYIPMRQPIYIPSSSSLSSSSYSTSSSLSINPASGLPMCGSVDVSGNAPGHSRHY